MTEKIGDNSSITTAGTFTATIEDDGNFKGNDDAMLMYFYRDRWEVSACERTGSGPNAYRFFFIKIPGTLPSDGTTNTYELHTEPNENQASATYWRSENGGHSPFQAKNGTLQVQYDGPTQHMSAFFNFEGQFGSRSLKITEGKFDLTGLTSHEVSVGNQHENISTYTATIKGKEMIDFTADEASIGHVSLPDGAKEYFIKGVQTAEFPPLPDSLVLFVREDVPVNAPYNFDANNTKIRASYHRFGREGDFQSTRGTAQLSTHPQRGYTAGTVTFNAINQEGMEVEVDARFSIEASHPKVLT